MEEKILLAELTKNCGEKKEKVLNLLEEYELAELGRDVWNQRFKDVENRVLNEHVFLCGHPELKVRCDEQPKFGERITDEKWSFLLSDEDFDRLQDLMRPVYVAENLTDEKGFFIENWNTIVCKARNELVDYIIMEIIPSALRRIFWENRDRIVFQEKLIKIAKDAFCKKVA